MRSQQGKLQTWGKTKSWWASRTDGMRITRTVFPKYWVKSCIWTKVYNRRITTAFDNVPAWHLQKWAFTYLSQNFKMENMMKCLVNSTLFYVRMVRINKGSHLKRNNRESIVMYSTIPFQIYELVSCTKLRRPTNMSSWGCLRQAYDRSSCSGSNNRLSVVV
jgi:hypothetical protein